MHLSKNRDSEEGFILKEEDSSFGIGLVTAVVFTILYILYWTTSTETRIRASLFSWIVLILALCGYLLMYAAYHVRLVFYDDRIEYYPFIGHKKTWTYDEISHISRMKHGFYLYDQTGKKVLFQTDLNHHPEIRDILRRHNIDVEVQMKTK